MILSTTLVIYLAVGVFGTSHEPTDLGSSAGNFFNLKSGHTGPLPPMPPQPSMSFSQPLSEMPRDVDPVPNRPTMVFNPQPEIKSEVAGSIQPQPVQQIPMVSSVHLFDVKVPFDREGERRAQSFAYQGDGYKGSYKQIEQSGYKVEQVYKQPEQSGYKVEQVYKQPEQSGYKVEQVYKQPEQVYKQPEQVYKQPEQVYKQPEQSGYKVEQVYKQPEQSGYKVEQVYKQPEQSGYKVEQVYKQPEQSGYKVDQVYKQPQQVSYVTEMSPYQPYQTPTEKPYSTPSTYQPYQAPTEKPYSTPSTYQPYSVTTYAPMVQSYQPSYPTVPTYQATTSAPMVQSYQPSYPTVPTYQATTSAPMVQSYQPSYPTVPSYQATTNAPVAQAYQMSTPYPFQSNIFTTYSSFVPSYQTTTPYPTASSQYQPVQNYQQAPPAQNYQQAPPAQNYQQAPPAQNYQQAPPAQSYQQAPPAQSYQQAPPAQSYQQAPPAQSYQQAPPAQNYQQAPPAQIYQQPGSQYPPMKSDQVDAYRSPFEPMVPADPNTVSQAGQYTPQLPSNNGQCSPGEFRLRPGGNARHQGKLLWFSWLDKTIGTKSYLEAQEVCRSQCLQLGKVLDQDKAKHVISAVNNIGNVNGIYLKDGEEKLGPFVKHGKSWGITVSAMDSGSKSFSWSNLLGFGSAKTEGDDECHALVSLPLRSRLSCSDTYHFFCEEP